MIRINLLSGGSKGRQAKPQYDVRAQAILGVGVVVVTLAGCWWYSAALDSELEARQEEKQTKEKQVAQLKEQVKQVQDFEQKKKLLEDMNRIIDQLEQSRMGPVKVLDHVSQSLEPLKVWLTKLGVASETAPLATPAREGRTPASAGMHPETSIPEPTRKAAEPKEAGPGKSDPFLVTSAEPGSVAAEQFRKLKTKIHR